MTAPRNPERRIHAFLVEGGDELPTRVYDAVRSEIDRTQQRVVIGPWRTPNMNTYAKLAMAAAAVVMVAIVGYNLMPSRSGVGGPAVAPSASPAPSTQPIASLPPAGPLAVGTYGIVQEGVRVTFTVPSPDWMSGGTWIHDGEIGQPDAYGITFWQSTFDNVYADPCAHTPLSPPAVATAAGLADALTSIPGTDLVEGPLIVTLGGHRAHHVVFTIRDDIDCEPHDFYLYYDERTGGASGGWRWADTLGTTYMVWIIDVDGTLVWIDAQTYEGAGPTPRERIQEVIDSIHFD